MNTIYMNSETRKTSGPHRLIFIFSDKINSKRSEKCFALSNLNMYYTWKNIKKAKKNGPIWNEIFKLSDGNSVLDIQDYFECIIKKHKNVTDNRPIRT